MRISLGLKANYSVINLPNLIHFFFFVVFGSVSILNHYYFRSSGLDYGLSNQALFQFAHFKAPIITETLSETAVNYFSCHLSFWVPIISPFYWLFGTYTLLIFQNIALIFAGIGLLKLADYVNLSKRISLILLIQFYSFFAIYAAIAFDFHDNVIGSCFLPWLLYYYLKNNHKGIIISCIAILISKENMAILLGFSAISFWFIKGSFTLKSIKIPILILVASVSWFLVSSLFIMPILSNQGTFEQLARYSHLGSSLAEIVSHILTHPLKMIELFYKSHIQPDDLEIVKQEFLLVLFISGGFALIRKPAFLLMAMPILMQKMWNKELAFWGIGYHYQIELAPIVAMAMVFWLMKIKNKKFQFSLALVMMLSTAGISIYKMDSRSAEYHHPECENIFSKAHYEAPDGFNAIKIGLQTIPINAIVCAQTNLMPSLSTRDKIYHFPKVKDASYLVFLQPGLNSYPLNQEKAAAFIDSIRNEPFWKEDSSYAPLRILIKTN